VNAADADRMETVCALFAALSSVIAVILSADPYFARMSAASSAHLQRFFLPSSATQSYVLQTEDKSVPFGSLKPSNGFRPGESAF
jgi:hypothetical protein